MSKFAKLSLLIATALGLPSILAGSMYFGFIPIPSFFPRSGVEQYQDVVVRHTPGIKAKMRVRKIDPSALYNYHETACGVVATTAYTGLVGVDLDSVKSMTSDYIRVQQRLDDRTADNIVAGLMDGAIAWGCFTPDIEAEF